jgi:hypothetical protein
MRSVRWVGRGAASVTVVCLLFYGQVSAAEHPTKFDDSNPLGDEPLPRLDGGGVAGPLGLPPGESPETKPAPALNDPLPPTFDDYGKTTPWPDFKSGLSPIQDGAVIYRAAPSRGPSSVAAAGDPSPSPTHRTGWLPIAIAAAAGLLVIGVVAWRVVRARRKPPVAAVPVRLGPPRVP